MTAILALTTYTSEPPQPAPRAATANETAAVTQSPAEVLDPHQELAAALEESFHTLEDSIEGTMGLALTPASGGDTLLLGPLQEDAAWSTSKVPIALAALRAGTGTSDDVWAALTVSDNPAAANLWNSLGAGEASGTAVDEVLRELGDETTTFTASPYAFGLTPWSLAAQSRFAAALHGSSTPEAVQVKEAMGHVTEEQRWGLGSLDGSTFKGGWGPDDQGIYLDRQMGFIELNDEIYGVAVAARHDDGTHESSLSALTSIAEWIGVTVEALPESG